MPNHRDPSFAENTPVITRYVIRAAAPWAALCAARSAELLLAESSMEVEALAGAPAPALLSEVRAGAFKGLRSTTAPIHVACAVDGRKSARNETPPQLGRPLSSLIFASSSLYWKFLAFA
jgi:hypothetical protein